MEDVIVDALIAFDLTLVAYVAVLNGWQLLLVLLAAGSLRRDRRVGVDRQAWTSVDDLAANPFLPGVSLVLPAHDEEPLIVDSVRAALGLRYPHLQVIVVDDGSTDGTFARLEEAFDLVPVPRDIPSHVPVLEPTSSVWAARDEHQLLVLRKASAGCKADAVNAGINVATMPLVCITDADAVLEPDALTLLVEPFVEDPARTVAAGGMVRAVNGSSVDRGHLGELRMPSGWLARIQVIEYLRSFLLGRVGWGRIGALLVISGAFGLFRHDVLVRIGGVAHDTVGEDAELVMRIHRRLREEGEDFRIAFVPQPVCWTQVPEDLATLGRQRRRWSRGLAEVLWRHRAMAWRPRYGPAGTVAVPYFAAFELLGPVVELAGLVSVVLGLALGLIDVGFALAVSLVAVGFGCLVSVVALLVEEVTFRRYRRLRDLLVAVAAAVVENLGYRQLHAWWRLRGMAQALSGREQEWGAMPRAAFAAPDGRS